MLSMVFSSSVFAANEEKASAWDSFLGLFSAKTAATSDVGVEYRGHIQNVGNYPLDGSWIQGPTELGTEGKGLRLEGFWIQLDGDVPAGAHIEYQVHVQNVGWMDPVQDGAFAGTEGKSQQIEAIKISLVDDEGVQLGDYSVVYTGHVQNIGDVGPYTNGEQLGTVGSFLRLEAITVEIVKNPVDLTEYEAALAAVTQADYTAASWTTYQAVVNANVVDEDNLQSEVDAATANITAAQKNLVEVLKVKSIVAVNQKQIEVTFNKPVDKTSALTESNYSFDGTKLNTLSGTTNYVALDDTKTVATIYYNTGFNQDQKVTVAVSGVLEDGTFTKMVDYSSLVTVKDVVNPTIVSATASNGNKDVTVKFSEVVTTPGYIADYTLNGQALSTFGINTVAFTTGTTSEGTQNLPNKVKISFNSSLPEGSYTLALKNNKVQDPANFYAVDQSATFTVTGSTTPLAVETISAVAGTSGTVEIKFNKDLGTIVTTANAYKINEVGVATPVFKTDLKNTIILTGNVLEGANIVRIPYTQKDAYGNAIGTTDLIVSVTAAKDTVKPTVTSVYSLSDKQLRIKFSENVNVAPFVTAKANYTIKDSEGTIVYSSAVNTAGYSIASNVNSDNTLVDVTFTTALPGSNYTIDIKGVKDGAGNEMDAYSTAFVSPDKTAPTLAPSPANKAVVNTTNKTIDVFFSEAMDSSTVTTKANYMYQIGSDWSTVPSSATIDLASNGKSVKITFPGTINIATITDIKVLNVKDVAGNLIKGGSEQTGTPQTATGVAPVIVNASAKVVADADKATVTFSTDQQITAIDKTNFGGILVDSGSTIGTTDPDNATVTGKMITLTYNSSNAEFAKIKAAGSTISLATGFNATGTTNEFGDVLTTTNMTTDGKKVADQIAPELIANASNPVKVTGANTITMEFNEAISGDNLGELKDDITVTTAGAYTQIDSTSVTGKTVTFTTKDSLSGGSVTLNINSAVSIKDVAGNLYVPTTDNKKIWTVDLTGTPATAAIKTADSALAASIAFDTATKITLAGGTDVTLTNVKALGAAYNGATNIDTVVAKLQLDIDAVSALNGKYVVSKGTGAAAGKLIITTVATGAAANVNLTGSDTTTGATLLGFTTLSSVTGSNASPLTSGNMAQ